MSLQKCFENLGDDFEINKNYSKLYEQQNSLIYNSFNQETDEINLNRDSRPSVLINKPNSNNLKLMSPGSPFKKRNNLTLASPVRFEPKTMTPQKMNLNLEEV